MIPKDEIGSQAQLRHIGKLSIKLTCLTPILALDATLNRKFFFLFSFLFTFFWSHECTNFSPDRGRENSFSRKDLSLSLEAFSLAVAILLHVRETVHEV